MLARPKLIALLTAPVLLYILIPARWLRDTLFVGAISCLTVSGFDLVLRLSKLSGEDLVYRRRLPQLPVLFRWEPNRDVVGTSWGDLASMANDPALRQSRIVRFQTDSLGFRNSHPPDHLDLLILGDSFGAGLGTTQDSTFSVRLERTTGQRVYTLSYPSSPHDEYVNLLVEFPHLSFQPRARIIWVLFMGNDLLDWHTELWDPATFPWQDGLGAWKTRYRNFRERSPVRHLLEGLYGAIAGRPAQEVLPLRRLVSGEPIIFRRIYQDEVGLTRDSAEHHRNFPSIERTMLEMGRLSRARGFELSVVLLPAKEEIYRWILEQRDRRPADREPSGFAQAILGVCAKLGLSCLDTKAMLTDEAYRRFDASGALIYWRDDTHLNDQGNAILAEYISRQILQDSAPVRR